MIRILIADDHNLFREGIQSILAGEKDLKIVGQAEDGKDLIAQYFKLEPDVVVSDINMPLKSGPDAAKSILNKYKDAKVLFLSQFTADDYIYSAVKCGAMGLISKNCMKNDLVFAIKEAYKGKTYFNDKSEYELEMLIKRFDNLTLRGMNVHLKVLTPKEKEVLTLIGEGFTSEQIAGKLNSSKRTIETHRHKIITSLGLNSVTELIKYAVLHNLEETKRNKLY